MMSATKVDEMLLERASLNYNTKDGASLDVVVGEYYEEIRDCHHILTFRQSGWAYSNTFSSSVSFLVCETPSAHHYIFS
jgi:hypothetical protein